MTYKLLMNEDYKITRPKINIFLDDGYKIFYIPIRYSQAYNPFSSRREAILSCFDLKIKGHAGWVFTVASLLPENDGIELGKEYDKTRLISLTEFALNDKDLIKNNNFVWKCLDKICSVLKDSDNDDIAEVLISNGFNVQIGEIE